MPPAPKSPPRRCAAPAAILVVVLLPLSYLLSTRALLTGRIALTASPSLPAPRIHASAPAACHRLLADARPFDAACNRTDRSLLACDGPGGPGTGAATFLGQYGQDHYVYTRHFARLPRGARTPLYVDVAANDAEHLSNTAVFDRCLGWRGVCVEPNPEYHAALRAQRSCALHAGCLAATDGARVDFVFNGGFSGVRGRMKFPPVRRTGGTLAGNETLTCERLASVLARQGMTRIDYLSVDVEGSEMQVLAGVDWGSVRFDVVSVEVSKRSLANVTELLQKNGLVRHFPDERADPKRTGLLTEDAIFVHHDVEFGSPR